MCLGQDWQGVGAPRATGQPLSLGQQQGALEAEGEQGSRWFFVWSWNKGEGPLPDPSPSTPLPSQASEAAPGKQLVSLLLNERPSGFLPETMSAATPACEHISARPLLCSWGAAVRKSGSSQDSGLLLNFHSSPLPSAHLAQRGLYEAWLGSQVPRIGPQGCNGSQKETLAGRHCRFPSPGLASLAEH